MNVIKKGDLIENVYERWVEQYRDCKYGHIVLIGTILKSEKPTTEEHIKRIIGNNSWTSNVCHECGNDSEIIIQLGEEPDYDSATVKICQECLKKALSLCCSQDI